MESDEKDTEKLTELNNLLKALGKLSTIAPAIKAPLLPSGVKLPKMPSAAPVSKKNVVNQAQQIADTNVKPMAVQQAKAQVKASKNQFAFKSEDGDKFYAFEGDERLNNEPMTEEDIKEKYGKDVRIVPVVNEKLDVAKNGQWTLS